jgi:hypothetical protein
MVDANPPARMSPLLSTIQNSRKSPSQTALFNSFLQQQQDNKALSLNDMVLEEWQHPQLPGISSPRSELRRSSVPWRELLQEEGNQEEMPSMENTMPHDDMQRRTRADQRKLDFRTQGW